MVGPSKQKMHLATICGRRSIYKQNLHLATICDGRAVETKLAHGRATPQLIGTFIVEKLAVEFLQTIGELIVGLDRFLADFSASPSKFMVSCVRF